MWALVYDLSWPAVITALSAFVTACGGCLMAWAAVVRARHEAIDRANEECLERLKEARQEATTLSDRLFRMSVERDLRPEEVTKEALYRQQTKLPEQEPEPEPPEKPKRHRQRHFHVRRGHDVDVRPEETKPDENSR